MDILPVREGATLDQLIDTLSRASNTANDASNLANYRVTEGMVAGPVDAYLAWTEAVEPQLRNVLDADFASELVRTTGYWSLRAASPDAVRVNTMVRTELDERTRVLNNLHDEIRAERVRWQRKVAPLLVPDTTLFVDPANPVDTVAWPALIDAQIDIRVVVPLIVIHELDRLKRQGNSSTGTQARNAIRWLSELLPSDTDASSKPIGSAAPHGTIEVYVHGGGSRPDDADWVIIQFARWLRTASGLPTALVTRDLGMALRARAAGIDAKHLPPPPISA